MGIVTITFIIFFSIKGGTVMKKVLYEVDIDEGVLITSDGMEYYVDPGDLTICCLWLPPVELEFFDNKIKNASTGETIQLL